MASNIKSVDPKNSNAGMAFLHEEEDHNHIDKGKEYGAEDRDLLKPQKAHLTDEFIIVAKFGAHALRRLASRLVNVIREGGRQTINLVLAKKNLKIHT